MNLYERPNPQEILEGIKLEEAQRNKGHLKIFLGMAAGVGKTYTMLEEAQVLKKEKIDVIIGNIESHGRKETEELLKNLPEIPKKTIIYKDKEFKELDVDAIISLNPNLVLVDELAHSNIPGSKHAKRWEDVLEILDHGINVYTTLNVQHIDSLNDIVWGITEVVVRETVPDMVIEKAYSIQLIDLTPDELLQRLKEGKVYTEGQSNIAALHFFQKDKLTALREIVLRYVADKIDVDLRRMVTTKEGRIEWKTREKFLVGISHSPQSQKLIRTTRRLATQANSPWVAVYVNTGKTLSKEDDEQLAKNLILTRALGAEVITIYDPDVAEGIKRVSYQRGITQIILGRTPKNLILSLFQGPSLLDKLAQECKDIDLHIIRQEKYTASYRKKSFFSFWESSFFDYLIISFFVCMMASLGWVALSFMGYRVVEFLFFIGIVVLSPFFKRGPVILASVLFGLAWSFFFIPPPEGSSFSVNNEIVLLVMYVLTAICIGFFVERAWEQKELLMKGDKKAARLAEVLQDLHSSLPLGDILVSLESRLPKVVQGAYQFVIKNDKGKLDMDKGSLLMGNKERVAAHWAFENRREAGWSTDTLPFSENLYIPLNGTHEIMGLLVYTPID
ncbi:MAG TPA: DUF4118 domain-containing protein, partial [Parachlamydiaceae bacterium]|nr:DUF4118 domain-containing protein [Parachlamydiaceae bacterium]